MTRAFITGVGGQDGSYLAERLLAEGVEVHALTHEAEPMPQCPGAVLHSGDLIRTDEVRALLLDLRPDEIYNLAALSSVAQSWSEPDLTAQVNGLAAVALMETAQKLQERTGKTVRFLQASSAEIFGEPQITPQDESTPIRPVNPYGAAKAYAHLMVDVYRRRDLHAVGAILYNHESPRRPLRFVARKITATVAAIAQGRADRLILGNLEARRDWGWAPDYVDAVVRALRAPVAQDFVVATGESHSVEELARTAFQHAGIDDWKAYVEVDPALLRPADPVMLTGNAGRARTQLGWTPTVGFADIVKQMVDADLELALPTQR